MAVLPPDGRRVDDCVDRQMALPSLKPSGCVVGCAHADGGQQYTVDHRFHALALATVQHVADRLKPITVVRSVRSRHKPLPAPKLRARPGSKRVQLSVQSLVFRPKTPPTGRSRSPSPQQRLDCDRCSLTLNVRDERATGSGPGGQSWKPRTRGCCSRADRQARQKIRVRRVGS